jgi:hypothetical protein
MKPKIHLAVRYAAIPALLFIFSGLLQPGPASGQTSPPQSDKPYIVEWVYRVKWGHKEEFFDIFRKYQIPVLEKEKQLGYVTDYSIYSPKLHTSEDSRWDYRVIIVYKNQISTDHAEEISDQLFPDRETLKKEEQRRWELTENHWDLPIAVVDLKTGK